MMHLLRTIHILSGVIWVGGVFFMTVFLLPSARAVGPAGAPLMGQLVQVRQVPKWLLITGFLTIVAGFWLYMLASSAAGPGWMKSGPAKVYGIGSVFAVVAWFLGMMVIAPLAKRLGALGAKVAASSAPPTAEDQAQMAAMQSRLATMSRIGLALLVLATVTMATARYVP